MAKGSKRLRDKSWELKAYAGLVEGKKRVLYQTIPPRQGRHGLEPIPERDADEALAKLVWRAALLRDGGSTGRRRQRQTMRRVTVRDAFEMWREHAREGLEPNGADTDEDILNNYVYPHLGDVELWRLRPGHYAAPGDPDYNPDLVSLTAYYFMLATEGSVGRRRLAPGTKRYDRDRKYVTVGAGKPLGSQTIRRVHGVVRRALDYCVQREWIPSNPAVGAKLPAIVKRPGTVPAAPDLDAFIGWLEDNDLETLCFIDLMRSGARRVDMGIQWGEVSFSADGTGGAVIFGNRGLISARDEAGRPTVQVRTTPTRKRRPRTVAIDAAAASRLMRLRTEQEIRASLADAVLVPTAYVFPEQASLDGSEPRDPGWFTSAFSRARRRAAAAGVTGLVKVRPYDVRHFMGTQLLAHGAPPAVVAERMGNSQRTMDAFYRHAVPAQDRAMAELLERILREASR